MKKVLLRIWSFIVRIFYKGLSMQDIIDMTSDGKVFSAEFIKKDGTVRTMKARTGVVKHLKGGSLAFDPKKKKLISVFDMDEQSYKFINFNTLQWIKISGKKYTNFINE